MTQNYYAHPTAIVDDGCKIGAGTKIWHFCHLMQGCSIGEHCILGQNVFVADGVRLGNGVKVQNNVSLYTGVLCADDVFIGPSVVFTNVLNPRSFLNRKDEFRATFVDRGASIGANATIVCGVRIGAFSLIGAGAVITKDVPAFALMIGNPARQNGWVSENGHRLHLDGLGNGVCPESSDRYYLVGGILQKGERSPS